MEYPFGAHPYQQLPATPQVGNADPGNAVEGVNEVKALESRLHDAIKDWAASSGQPERLVQDACSLIDRSIQSPSHQLDLGSLSPAVLTELSTGDANPMVLLAQLHEKCGMQITWLRLPPKMHDLPDWISGTHMPALAHLGAPRFRGTRVDVTTFERISAVTLMRFEGTSLVIDKRKECKLDVTLESDFKILAPESDTKIQLIYRDHHPDGSIAFEYPLHSQKELAQFEATGDQIVCRHVTVAVLPLWQSYDDLGHTGRVAYDAVWSAESQRKNIASPEDLTRGKVVTAMIAHSADRNYVVSRNKFGDCIERQLALMKLQNQPSCYAYLSTRGHAVAVWIRHGEVHVYDFTWPGGAQVQYGTKGNFSGMPIEKFMPAIDRMLTVQFEGFGPLPCVLLSVFDRLPDNYPHADIKPAGGTVLLDFAALDEQELHPVVLDMCLRMCGDPAQVTYLLEKAAKDLDKEKLKKLIVVVAGHASFARGMAAAGQAFLEGLGRLVSGGFLDAGDVADESKLGMYLQSALKVANAPAVEAAVNGCMALLTAGVFNSRHVRIFMGGFNSRVLHTSPACVLAFVSSLLIFHRGGQIQSKVAVKWLDGEFDDALIGSSPIRAGALARGQRGTFKAICQGVVRLFEGNLISPDQVKQLINIGPWAADIAKADSAIALINVYGEVILEAAAKGALTQDAVFELWKPLHEIAIEPEVGVAFEKCMIQMRITNAMAEHDAIALGDLHRVAVEQARRARCIVQ